ncbi:MAG: GDP-mannose 4,6-dehydratase [Candidatus Aenigmarchaeota archaeon]|nr:GDP-mannose 4,6-dehydratase [Candidatus Aenigmarchaeota archaeon]
MSILITGGCGFIGCNFADYFLNKGEEVTVLDNFYRFGSKQNMDWLKSRHKEGLTFLNADVKDPKAMVDAVRGRDMIIHTAGQVTVTDSVTDPRNDMEINILGTFNILDAARLSNENPFVLFTSTNKVYGEGINSIDIEEAATRWKFADPAFKNGIPETFTTDFDKHSPYGVSKYSADLYVRDFSHVYGMPAVSFRQSCIYGTRQFGKEEQGWLAHFVISSFFGRPLNIFGDGKQVRDVLFIEDLCRAADMASENRNKTAGKAYNIGGGAKYTLSLLELIEMLEKINNRKISTKYFDWRPADQKVYISNINKAMEDFGWEPKVSPEEGVKRVHGWVEENPGLFK